MLYRKISYLVAFGFVSLGLATNATECVENSLKIVATVTNVQVTQIDSKIVKERLETASKKWDINQLEKISSQEIMAVDSVDLVHIFLRAVSDYAKGNRDVNFILAMTQRLFFDYELLSNPEYVKNFLMLEFNGFGYCVKSSANIKDSFCEILFSAKDYNKGYGSHSDWVEVVNGLTICPYPSNLFFIIPQYIMERKQKEESPIQYFIKKQLQHLLSLVPDSCKWRLIPYIYFLKMLTSDVRYTILSARNPNIGYNRCNGQLCKEYFLKILARSSSSVFVLNVLNCRNDKKALTQMADEEFATNMVNVNPKSNWMDQYYQGDIRAFSAGFSKIVEKEKRILQFLLNLSRPAYKDIKFTFAS